MDANRTSCGDHFPIFTCNESLVHGLGSDQAHGSICQPLSSTTRKYQGRRSLGPLVLPVASMTLDTSFNFHWQSPEMPLGL